MKTLSHDDYLKALGLFTLACHHADQATVFDNALAAHLGYDDGEHGYYPHMGHISDNIYVGLTGTRDAFLTLLKKEGFEVEEPIVRNEEERSDLVEVMFPDVMRDVEGNLFYADGKRDILPTDTLVLKGYMREVTL